MDVLLGLGMMMDRGGVMRWGWVWRVAVEAESYWSLGV
jgi:hypothetical protein